MSSEDLERTRRMRRPELPPGDIPGVPRRHWRPPRPRRSRLDRALVAAELLIIVGVAVVLSYIFYVTLWEHP